MANLDSKYDIENRTAAFENHASGILVSLAGPGTGKTYSLLKRIEALIKRGGDVESICYLTFIKEISNAFIDDYIGEFGLPSYETSRPRISTLHSFACRLLRNQGFQLGFDGELYFLSITDNDDDASKIFLEDLLPFIANDTIHTPPQLKRALDQIKNAWRNLVNPDTLPDPDKLIIPLSLDLLHAYRLFDWDQTIPMAHELFTKLTEYPKWLSQIKHFLVDEYQDFNRAEQSFITSLSSISKSMVIVGDDNQSLYSNRGGSPEGLRELYSSTKCDQISLLKCRRCKSMIVEAANTFLTSTQPHPRLMQSHKGGGGVVSFRFKSSKAEIEFLKVFLTSCIQDLPETAQPKDGIICLFPTWKILNYYFDQLSPHLPCAKRKKQTLPSRLRLHLALQLVSHPNQRFIERLILENYNLIMPRHKKEMVKLILQRDISPTRAVEILISDGIIKDSAETQATNFIDFCASLSSRDPEAIAISLSDVLHLDPEIIRQQIDVFLGYIRTSEQEDVLEQMCDNLIPESVPPVEDPKAILFLTIHGAKGLTKKTVVMPGLEEAWLPGNVLGEDLEEKKRIFYVALTRATDMVLITLPQRRGRGDPLNYSTPGLGRISPFIIASGIPCPYHE
jgi:DNA helicase-2/ATP-dependent DNA helicase PcrA